MEPPPASTTLVPLPTETIDPNFGRLRIKDDILYPKGEAPYLGYDLQARIFLFAITQLVPVVSACLLVFTRKGWWKMSRIWTMSRMVVLWLVSIQMFGAVVYAQRGATTRMLFLAASIHLQIEYLIIALLLKASPFKGLLYAWIGGTILYSIQLFVEDLSIVYITSTIAGFTDFLIPVLFVYGKQWIYAIGGFAHLAQAVGVFCIVVKNYGHKNFNIVTFITTWLMNGALVVAVLQSWGSKGGWQPIRLRDDHEGANGAVRDSPAGEAADNPLAGVDIPQKTLLIMFAVSVVGSTISAFFFVFIVGKD